MLRAASIPVAEHPNLLVRQHRAAKCDAEVQRPHFTAVDDITGTGSAIYQWNAKKEQPISGSSFVMLAAIEACESRRSRQLSLARPIHADKLALACRHGITASSFHEILP